MTTLRFLALPLLLVSTAVQGQSFRGVVLETDREAAIPGALVEVYYRGDLLTAARTDDAGGFLLFPRRSGRLEVRVTHPAYVSIDPIQLTAQDGEIVSLEFRMGRNAVPLEPVLVVGRTEARLIGFQERLRRGTFGSFITRDDIDRRPAARTTDLLREVPAVEVLTVLPSNLMDPAVPRVARLAMRSAAGPCSPAVYLDGMPIRQTAVSGIDDFLKPDMLEGVEIYSGGGAPVEFDDPRMCGVIAFWSRAALEGRGWSWARLGAGAAAFLMLVAFTR